MKDHWDCIVSLLRQLTACAGDPTAYRRPAIDKAFLVRPSSTGSEYSPALSGSGEAVSMPAHDAPRYLNRAFMEILANGSCSGNDAGDPQGVRELLETHRRTSNVPWIFNELLNEVEYRTGAPVPSSVPAEVHLATTGACNTSCKFCGYTPELARFEFATAEQVKNLGILRYTRMLRLSSGWGTHDKSPPGRNHQGRSRAFPPRGNEFLHERSALEP